MVEYRERGVYMVGCTVRYSECGCTVGEFTMFPAQIGGNEEPLETYKAS